MLNWSDHLEDAYEVLKIYVLFDLYLKYHI